MDFVISVGAGSGLPTTGRDGKGRSLLAALDSYVIVDIETTGLSPRYDEIIEVAALRVEGGKARKQPASALMMLLPEARIDKGKSFVIGGW